MGREEQCKEISPVCVGTAHSIWTTLGLPQLTMCVLSWSTLLRLKVTLHRNCPKQALDFAHFPGLSCSGSGSRVLHKGTDLVEHVFCALPRSEKLRQPGTWWAHCPRWSVHLNHHPGPGCLVSWMHHKSAISGVPCVSSGELISGCNPSGRCQCPGSQEDLVSNGETAHNLVDDSVSRAEIAPCLPALAITYLSLCLQRGNGLVCSWLALLWYSLNPLFCELARLRLRLELFAESSLSLSYFFSLSLDIPQFGLLSHVSSLRLASGHSGPVLTLSRQPAPPFQPPLCGGGHKHLGYFSAESCG